MPSIQVWFGDGIPILPSQADSDSIRFTTSGESQKESETGQQEHVPRGIQGSITGGLQDKAQFHSRLYCRLPLPRSPALQCLARPRTPRGLGVSTAGGLLNPSVTCSEDLGGSTDAHPNLGQLLEP